MISFKGKHLLESFKKNKKLVGLSWSMEETYVKVKGVWMYQYRAVDKKVKTIDCYFSEKRDKKAATKFFMRSMSSSGKPEKVNIDKSGSNIYALKDINSYLPESEKIQIRQNKYLIYALAA